MPDAFCARILSRFPRRPRRPSAWSTIHGVVLDSSGTIRFIGVLPSDAFEGNGYIEKVLRRMFAKSTSKRN